MAKTSVAQGGKDFLLKLGNGAYGAVTFTDSGDLVTLNSHGLSNGDKVRFSVITTTTGIVINTDYFVVNASTNTFQVSATLGGSALTLTSDGTGTLDEYFNSIAGLRSTTLSLAAEAIDITNQDSSQWKELLNQAGIKSATISGSGVFKDDIQIARARALVLSQALRNFKVIDNTSGDYFAGSFKITSLEQAGDYNNEQTWSLSLESSGPITYTEV